MKKKVDPVVDEAIETLNMKDGPTRRRLIEGAGLVSATAAASALIAACTSSSTSSRLVGRRRHGGRGRGLPEDAVVAVLVRQPRLHQHVLRPDPVRLRRRRRAARTCRRPSGAARLDVERVADVSYLQTAIAARRTASRPRSSAPPVHHPGRQRDERGHPGRHLQRRRDRHANGAPNIGTNRLCYVGQALYLSGQQLGERIKSLVTTPGEIVIFIATPGTGNIQPRYDGAASVLEPAGYTVSEIATGATTSVELAAEKAYLLGHKSVKGAFAVDAGSTEFLAQALAGAGLSGQIPAGGFDLTPVHASAIKAGSIDFTIDQKPYLQGFLPTLYLYMYNLSGGLVPPPDTDTGLSFVTKTNVGPYLASTSRFEGSTAAQKSPAAVRRRSRTRSPRPAPDRTNAGLPSRRRAPVRARTGSASAWPGPAAGGPRARWLPATGPERRLSQAFEVRAQTVGTQSENAENGTKT